MADGATTPRSPQAGNGLFNALAFMVQQALARMNTATLVKVVAVHTDGRTAPVGTVDVQPLVDLQDGAGNPTPHTTVSGIPYLRIQGGPCAVIIDPVVGDVGLCAFADRDTSRVRATGDHALPGSFRRFDFADGFYLGGWNAQAAAPTCYLVIDGTSVSVVHPDGVDVTTPTLTINGDLVVNGAIQATGDVVADSSGSAHHLSTHVHSGVQTGGGNTGGPVG
jgi:hypothetical protein